MKKRGNEKKIREREREGRMCEQHDVYFGAARDAPRGGQCPSLLRPKEGGRETERMRE